MKQYRYVAMTFAFAFAAAFSAGSCALFQKKVKDIPSDIRQCFGPDVKGDLGDLVSGIETALVCSLSSGGNALPACVAEGLQTIAEEIGPSGKADVMCVINKIAADAAARAEKPGLTPEEVVRDQRARRISERGTACVSPADGSRAATDLTSCDTYCGAGHGLPVPGGGCNCWRGEGQSGRWVAAR